MDKNCKHNWEEYNNKFKCTKCNQESYKKFELDEDNYYIIKDNGQHYTVRKSRTEYIYPDDWKKFINLLKKEEHKLFFDFLIKTGARVEEALLVKRSDLVDDRRKKLKLRVTKRKAKKKDESSLGEPRAFQIDSRLYNKLKQLEPGYLFLNINKDTPYTKAKKEAKVKSDTLRQLLDRKMKQLNIKGISFHNIRKTHGMYLRVLDVGEGEICGRLGHDYNTYLKHYNAPSLFDRKDKKEIVKILGDIYGLK